MYIHRYDFIRYILYGFCTVARFWQLFAIKIMRFNDSTAMFRCHGPVSRRVPWWQMRFHCLWQLCNELLLSAVIEVMEFSAVAGKIHLVFVYVQTWWFIVRNWSKRGSTYVHWNTEITICPHIICFFILVAYPRSGWRTTLLLLNFLRVLRNPDSILNYCVSLRPSFLKF